MKKIIVALALMFAVFSTATAQTTTPQSTATSKEAIAAQKKADKEAKKLAKQQQHDALEAQKKADKDAKVAQKSTGLTKNGMPDKRLKANRQPAPVAPVQTSTQAQTTTTATKTQTQATTVPSPTVTKSTRSQVTQGTNTGNDKAVGTDDKGRTIYEGPRGGHYYIDKNGHKEYIKTK